VHHNTRPRPACRASRGGLSHPVVRFDGRRQAGYEGTSLILQRDNDLDIRAAPRSRAHVDPPTQNAEPFTHADQSHPEIAPPGLDAIDVEADAVILNGAVQDLGHPSQLYARAGGLRVPRHVVQRLLYYAIDRRLNGLRQAAERTRVDGDDEPAALLDAGGEEFERRHQADFLEHPRPYFVRDATQLFFDGVEIFADFVEPLAGGLRDVRTDVAEREMRGREQLSRFVVQGLRDRLRLAFEMVVHAAVFRLG